MQPIVAEAELHGSKVIEACRPVAAVRVPALACGRGQCDPACPAEGAPRYQGSRSDVYLGKALDDTGWLAAERLPVARELGVASMMFPVHATLTAAEFQEAVDGLGTVLTQVSQW